MKKEELIELLNGREYRDEVTPEIREQAKKSGLVIVYGASDDLMELDGAVYEEMGTDAYFNYYGLVTNDCHDQDCPYYQKAIQSAHRVRSEWCKTDEYSWTFKTRIPHATFDIMEDGEKFCKGIVFGLMHLSQTQI